MKIKIRFKSEIEEFVMNSWWKNLGTVREKVKECRNWELNGFKLFFVTNSDHRIEISNQSDYEEVLERNTEEDLLFEVIEFDDDFMTISDVFTQVRNISSCRGNFPDELSTERPDINNIPQSVYEIQVFDDNSVSNTISQQDQENQIWDNNADHLHIGNEMPIQIPSEFKYTKQNYDMQIQEDELYSQQNKKEEQPNQVEQLKLLIMSNKLMVEKMEEMNSKALTKDEFKQGMEAVNTKVASLEGYQDKIDKMVVKVDTMAKTIENLQNSVNNKDIQKDIVNRIKKVEKLIKDKKEVNYQKELDDIKKQQEKQLKNQKTFFDNIQDKICDLQNDLSQINEDVKASSKKIDTKLKKTNEKMKKLVKNQEQLESNLNEKFKTSVNNTIHCGVSCDECGITEIKGTRYHCLICKDYDLCEQCERVKGHNHDMIKFVKETKYKNPILVDKHKLKIKGMTKKKEPNVDKGKLESFGMPEKKEPKVDKAKFESFKTYLDACVAGYEKEKEYYIKKYDHLDLSTFLSLLNEKQHEWFPE